MGGAVSAGDNNDELIDNLIEGKYIRSEQIKEVFRAVDRGNYYVPEYRSSAYQDMAWKHRNFHLSAPCIYSEVMEHLDLRPGLSFLNIGSGTGYINTMCGLILGSTGINHGIEIHEDVVEFAKGKVQEFILSSKSFDWFDFCVPQFVVGNCLNLQCDVSGYDRIYCGAACPSDYKNYMCNLLNVGGKLVIPMDDQLNVITRNSDTKWETEGVMSVSFARLIMSENVKEHLNLPERRFPTLFELCRYRVRKSVRGYCCKEIEQEKKKRPKFKGKKDTGDEGGDGSCIYRYTGNQPHYFETEPHYFESMDTETVSSGESEAEESSDEYNDCEEMSNPSSDSIAATTSLQTDSERSNSPTQEQNKCSSDEPPHGQLTSIVEDNATPHVSARPDNESQSNGNERNQKWRSSARNQRRLRLIQTLRGYATSSQNSHAERGVLSILSGVLRRRRRHRNVEISVNSETVKKEENSDCEMEDNNNMEEPIDDRIAIQETSFYKALLSLPLPPVLKRYLLYNR